jgi:signal transduction histidine kinase
VILSVLALGLAGSTVAAGRVSAGERRAAAEALTRQAGVAQQTVADEMDRYGELVNTIAAALSEQADLTAVDFATITAPMLDQGLDGVTGAGLVVPAQDSEVAATQDNWRRHGATGLDLRPDGTGREHLFSVFSRSLDGVPSTPGRDLAAAPEPARALTEARRTGRLAVSDTYVLLKDRALAPDQQQLSFTLVAPVYQRSREQGLRGWFLLGLRGQDFIRGGLAAAVQNRAAATLSAPASDGHQVVVARLGSAAPGAPYRDKAVQVAGRRWTVRVSAVGAAFGLGLAGPATAGVGLVITLLLVGLIWAMMTARISADLRVAAATAGLATAEREARRQAGLLTAIVNSIGDGVGVVDENGDFLLHNPAAQRMLGIGVDIGGPDGWQEHYGIFRPDGHTPFPDQELPLVRALSGEATDDVEMVIRNAGQPKGIRINVTARPLDNGAKRRGAVAVFHDVTAHREREAELAAFAGVVAHDLKSPLAVVAGFVELIEDELLVDDPDGGFVSPPGLRTSIHRISAGVDRMRRLIDDLLTYATARDAPLRPAVVDLATAARTVTADLTSHLPANVESPQVYLGMLAQVYADPSLLRRVLDNLIGNALKYTPPGQPARVDVTARVLRPGWVHVEVTDRGIGIPEGQHLAIFEGFHRAHAQKGYAGTGLGLAICRRVVERHGGSIGAADNPGGGARFWFTLPAAPVPTEASPGASPGVDAPVLPQLSRVLDGSRA